MLRKLNENGNSPSLPFLRNTWHPTLQFNHQNQKSKSQQFTTQHPFYPPGVLPIWLNTKQMGRMLSVIICGPHKWLSGPWSMQNYRSATLPNRKYGGRVAQKKAIFESLATDNLSSVSTSSIEFSTAPSYRSADFSDRKTPFSFTYTGYKTMIDRNTQTEMDLGLEKVGLISSLEKAKAILFSQHWL